MTLISSTVEAVITLGQTETDNINQTITLTED